jgi:hypothetical protein
MVKSQPGVATEMSTPLMIASLWPFELVAESIPTEYGRSFALMLAPRRPAEQ